MHLSKKSSHNSFNPRLMISSAFLLLLPLLICASISVQPPQPIPSAIINIFTPANDSTVRSPIELEYQISCQPDSILRIELIDQNQTLLYRKLITQNCAMGETISQRETIFFDITPKTKFGRLSVSTQDAKKVSVALSSSLLNFSAETEIIHIATDHQSNLFITAPVSNSFNSGGELQLSGWARLYADNPIILELLTQSGGLIASRQIAIPENYAGDYFFFETSIPYIVNRIQDVYLVMRQFGDSLSGNIALERTSFQIAP